MIVCLIISIIMFLIATLYLFKEKSIKQNKLKLTLSNFKSIGLRLFYLLVNII
jgi:hypothetical protein